MFQDFSFFRCGGFYVFVQRLYALPRAVISNRFLCPRPSLASYGLGPFWLSIYMFSMRYSYPVFSSRNQQRAPLRAAGQTLHSSAKGPPQLNWADLAPIFLIYFFNPNNMYTPPFSFGAPYLVRGKECGSNPLLTRYFQLYPVPRVKLSCVISM